MNGEDSPLNRGDLSEGDARKAKPPRSRVQRRREAWERVSWTRAYRFMGGLLLRHPVALATALVLGLALAGAEFLSIGLIMPFITSLSPGGSDLIAGTPLGFLLPYFESFSTVEKVRVIAVGLIAIQFVKAGLTYSAGRVAHYIQLAVDRDLKLMSFDHALSVDLAYHNREQLANIYTMVRTYPADTTKLATEFLKGIPKAASLVAYVFILLALSWKLTLLAAVLVVLASLVVNTLVNLVKRMSWEINEAKVRQSQVTLESLQGLKVIHLFGREDHTRSRFRTMLEDVQARSYRRGTLQSLISPLHTVLNTTLFAAVIIAATFMFEQTDEAWLVFLTAFIVVMVRVLGPATNLIKRRTKIASALPSVQMLLEFLDRSDKPFMADGDRPFSELESEVRFDSVTFRYEATSPPAVDRVSFTIPRGRTVALVGGSGAGKTTIINLLARLYDPSEGRILVDGQDLRSYQRTAWRRALAVVSQDTFLFNESVRENIRYGRLDASDEEVEAAARLANAHEFILAMEHGYDTYVGDRGVRLSGGQAQRIAIARAVLADPEILILDEATSALDTNTERKVQEALERLSRDRTVVAIAHRLSTVRNADHIVVLEQGRVVERGTHDELLERHGAYWRYVQLQDLAGTGASEPAPTRPEHRLVLRPGRRNAALHDNGSLLADELRVVAVADAAGAESALGKLRGDAAILSGGADEASVWFRGELLTHVPLFVERRDASGRPHEVRVSVREVRRRPQVLPEEF